MKTTTILQKNIKPFIDGFIYKTSINGLFIDKEGCVYKYVQGINSRYLFKIPVVLNKKNEIIFSFSDKEYNLYELIKNTFFYLDGFNNYTIHKKNDSIDNNRVSNFIITLSDEDFKKYCSISLNRIVGDYEGTEDTIEDETITDGIDIPKDVTVIQKSRANNKQIKFCVFIYDVLEDMKYYASTLTNIQNLTGYKSMGFNSVLSKAQNKGNYKQFYFAKKYEDLPKVNKVYTDFIKKRKLKFSTNVYSMTNVSTGEVKYGDYKDVEMFTGTTMKSLSGRVLRENEEHLIKGHLIRKVKIILD